MSASAVEDVLVRKSDFEYLIKSIASLKESDKALDTLRFHKPIIIDSSASHRMIIDASLIDNFKLASENVVMLMVVMCLLIVLEI